MSFNRSEMTRKREQQCIPWSSVVLVQVSQCGITEHKEAKIHFKQLQVPQLTLSLSNADMSWVLEGNRKLSNMLLPRESSSSLWLCMLKEPHGVEVKGQLTEIFFLALSPGLKSCLPFSHESHSKPLLVIHLCINSVFRKQLLIPSYELGGMIGTEDTPVSRNVPFLALELCGGNNDVSAIPEVRQCCYGSRWREHLSLQQDS